MKDINRTFVPEHEMQGIRDRAINRAEKKFEAREHLRLEIKSRRLLDDLDATVIVLRDGVEPIVDRDTGEIDLRPIGRDRVASLKAGADIALKLLNKVLPDIKQVEIQDSSNGGEGRILENTDLSNRMRLYMEAVQQRGIEEPVIVDAEIVEDVDFLA